MTLTRRSLLLLLALAWPLPSAAAADPAALAAATERLAEAGEALAAAQAGEAGLGPLAEAIARYGRALAALRADVQASAAREAALAQDLEARRVEVARLLAAMEAMSAAPGQALHPEGPLAAARAGAMIARLRPAMRAEAGALAAQVAEMRAARERHAEGRTALAAGLATLAGAQVALAEAMARAEPEPAEAADPSLTMLARDSASLGQLAAALAEVPGAPPPPPGTAEAMAWPVAGTVASHFNDPDAARVRRPGIVVATAPLALVTAPADALVRYAGPFLEYGYVVVLEPAADTMVVLAGLARLQVATGDAVGRGDLLGLMGGRPPDVEEYVMLPEAETGAGAGETLYIEVRHGKGPVDPEPLFVGQNG
jgi:septal ring factor EnvC (AmiA/AmiB activator)